MSSRSASLPTLDMVGSRGLGNRLKAESAAGHGYGVEVGGVVSVGVNQSVERLKTGEDCCLHLAEEGSSERMHCRWGVQWWG